MVRYLARVNVQIVIITNNNPRVVCNIINAFETWNDLINGENETIYVCAKS